MDEVHTLKISIAMATYNGEKFLKKQLDSIYGQTVKNIEVIVSDDCSTDSTVAILKEYSHKFGLKYFVNDANIGFVRNFEKAISYCQGDLIALADQDDVWLPEKLETLINEIGGKSLICSDAELIDEEGNTISDSFGKYSNIIDISGKPFIYYACNTFVTGCTVLFKRELLNTALPFPKSVKLHDYWLGLAAKKRNGIKYLSLPLVKYRQHTNNQIGAINNKDSGISSTKILKRIFRIKEFFAKENKEKIVNSYLNAIGFIDTILNSRLILETEEKLFFERLKSSYLSIIDGKVKLRVLFFIYSNRKIIFYKREERFYYLLLHYLITLCTSRRRTDNTVS